jgi:hypothetical protein
LVLFFFSFLATCTLRALELVIQYKKAMYQRKARHLTPFMGDASKWRKVEMGR